MTFFFSAETMRERFAETLKTIEEWKRKRKADGEREHIRRPLTFRQAIEEWKRRHGLQDKR